VYGGIPCWSVIGCLSTSVDRRDTVLTASHVLGLLLPWHTTANTRTWYDELRSRPYSVTECRSPSTFHVLERPVSSERSRTVYRRTGHAASSADLGRLHSSRTVYYIIHRLLYTPSHWPQWHPTINDLQLLIVECHCGQCDGIYNRRCIPYSIYRHTDRNDTQLSATASQ